MLPWKRPPVALAAALLCAVGCGGSVRIEPLIGDEAQLLRHVRTTVPDLSTHAPTRAVHALYEALVKEDLDAAWELLSGETRETLNAAARACGAPSGKALFVTSADRGGVPLVGPDGKTVRVPSLEWLLASEISYYLLTLDPEQPPEQSDSEAIVYVIDTNERFRAIEVRRQGDRWLVHHPSLRVEDIPGATTEVGRTALP